MGNREVQPAPGPNAGRVVEIEPRGTGGWLHPSQNAAAISLLLPWTICCTLNRATVCELNVQQKRSAVEHLTGFFFYKQACGRGVQKTRGSCRTSTGCRSRGFPAEERLLGRTCFALAQAECAGRQYRRTHRTKTEEAQRPARIAAQRDLSVSLVWRYLKA